MYQKAPKHLQNGVTLLKKFLDLETNLNAIEITCTMLTQNRYSMVIEVFIFFFLNSNRKHNHMITVKCYGSIVRIDVMIYSAIKVNNAIRQLRARRVL